MAKIPCLRRSSFARERAKSSIRPIVHEKIVGMVFAVVYVSRVLRRYLSYGNLYDCLQGGNDHEEGICCYGDRGRDV